MRWARPAALVLLCASCVVGWACSTSTKPLGSGDDVVSDVDTDASTEAESPGAGGDDSSYDAAVFAPVDAYALAPDGYVPFDWCSQCGCPADTFCFGGGSTYTTFDGDCHVEAGALTDAASLAIGCYPVPTSCVGADAACDCLIESVSPFMPCYPVCSITTNIVYCPSP